jgi:hypothetical protein
MRDWSCSCGDERAIDPLGGEGGVAWVARVAWVALGPGPALNGSYFRVSGALCRSPGGRRLSWAASFMKDFVVVKDLLRPRVENPSQQQKFT